MAKVRGHYRKGRYYPSPIMNAVWIIWKNLYEKELHSELLADSPSAYERAVEIYAENPNNSVWVLREIGFVGQR